MNKVNKDIIDEYKMEVLSTDYYRTPNGRAYIEKIEQEDGSDLYEIFSCNGNYIGFAKNLRLACIKAMSV